MHAEVGLGRREAALLRMRQGAITIVYRSFRRLAAYGGEAQRGSVDRRPAPSARVCRHTDKRMPTDITAAYAAGTDRICGTDRVVHFGTDRRCRLDDEVLLHHSR
jgi:hypothetical protein